MPLGHLATRPRTLYLLSLIATLLMAPTTSVYWDSFGYLIQSVTGQVGGLGLGRPVYVLVSHAVVRGWLAASGSPWSIEPLLRGLWLAVAALAAPLTWRLALACGLTPRAAWFAGLAVAVSPAMAHTSGQVLTDAPAAAVGLAAILWAIKSTRGDQGARGPGDQGGGEGRWDGGTAWDGGNRGGRWDGGAAGDGGNRGGRWDGGAGTVRWSAIAGGLLGLAIGLREQSMLHAATLAWLVVIAPSGARVRLAVVMCLACAVVVCGPMAWVWWTQPGYAATIARWGEGLREDRALRTFGARDLAVYLAWMLSLGPLVVLAALRLWTARRSPVWRVRTPLVALALPALLQLLWMLSMRGVSYSPRFLLSAFPLALALPGAYLLDLWAARSSRRARLVIVGLVAPLVIAAPLVRWQGAATEATLRDWPQRLLSLPTDTVIVSGQPCPKIGWVETIVSRDRTWVGAAPDWQSVCPGWAWPTDLAARLDAALAEGRSLALDLRTTSWVGAEQRASRVELERNVAARTAAPPGGRIVIWRDEAPR